MTNKRILITDRAHSLLQDGLVKKGMKVDYCPAITYDEVKDVVHQYNGIIINSKIICDKDFLKKAGQLDFIGRLGSGLDIIDLDETRYREITVLRAPEGNANAVAEHTVGMILCLINKIGFADQQIKTFHWDREPFRGAELAGKTIGIVGFGHTGSALAGKLKSWDMTILTYDKYLTKKKIIKAAPYVRPVSFKEVLTYSDIISLHLPLTDETRNWFDKSIFQRMKKGSILINTSRGAIVKTEDLSKALHTGRLGGACLDVLENEKFDTLTRKQQKIYRGLFQLPSVILTPHVAGWTIESFEKISRVMLNKIVKLYDI